MTDRVTNVILGLVPRVTVLAFVPGPSRLQITKHRHGRAGGHPRQLSPRSASAFKAMPMARWQPKEPCLYILASKRDGVLYTGVTSAIFDRMLRHRSGADEGFTKRYRVHTLVYCEFHATMADAIQRKTRIKKWQRAWKVRLILETNPEWLDLFDPGEGIKEPPADVARRYREP